MPIEIRPIVADELEAWIDVMHVAFHANGPVAAAAAWRREVGIAYERTLAALDDGHIVGTYETYAAELTLPGNACVRTDAITSVTVLPTHHRRGVLTRMIRQDLATARERGDAAAILLASEYPIYGRFGFGPATQRAEYTIDPAQVRFTRPATRRVELVSRQRMRQVAPAMFDAFRQGYPGQISRADDLLWDARVGLRQSPYGPQDRVVRCVLSLADNGQPDGYLLFRMEDVRQPYRPGGLVEVAELIAQSPDAYLSLCRFVCELDLIGEIRLANRRTREPLAWLLDNPRTAMQLGRLTDFLWVRPLDVPALLSTRHYSAEGSLVLELDDPLGLAGGRYRLDASVESGSSCRSTSESAEIRMGISALGALCLGGVSARDLHAAGLVQAESPRGLTQIERLFEWPIEPWCSTFF